NPTNAILMFHEGKGSKPFEKALHIGDVKPSTIAEIYLPLTGKRIDVSGEETVNLKPYLKAGINPVVLIPYKPIDINVSVSNVNEYSTTVNVAGFKRIVIPDLGVKNATVLITLKPAKGLVIVYSLHKTISSGIRQYVRRISIYTPVSGTIVVYGRTPTIDGHPTHKLHVGKGWHTITLTANQVACTHWSWGWWCDRWMVRYSADVYFKPDKTMLYVTLPNGKTINHSETIRMNPSGVYRLVGFGSVSIRVLLPSENSEYVKVIKGWHTFTKTGEYTIRSVAVNEYGLKAEDAINVSVGQSGDTPPTVKIVKPIVIDGKAIALPNNVEIEAIGSDNNAVEMMKISIRGKKNLDFVRCYNSKRAKIDWSLKLPTGTYKLTVYAMDNLGQIGKESVTLIVRNVRPPTIRKLEIVAPVHWGTTKNCVYSSVSLPTDSEFTVKAEVQKGDYPIAYVEFSTTPNVYWLRYYDACAIGHYTNGLWGRVVVRSPPYLAKLEVGWNFHNPYIPETQLVIAKVCDIYGFCSWKAFYFEGYPTEKPPEPPQVTILTPTGSVKPETAWIKVRVVEPSEGHQIGSVMGYISGGGHTIATPYFSLLSGNRQNGI
ncbi:hypothetical protein, partial [Archaeoglobus sp.]